MASSPTHKTPRAVCPEPAKPSFRKANQRTLSWFPFLHNLITVSPLRGMQTAAAQPDSTAWRPRNLASRGSRSPRRPSGAAWRPPRLLALSGRPAKYNVKCEESRPGTSLKATHRVYVTRLPEIKREDPFDFLA